MKQGAEDYTNEQNKKESFLQTELREGRERPYIEALLNKRLDDKTCFLLFEAADKNGQVELREMILKAAFQQICRFLPAYMLVWGAERGRKDIVQQILLEPEGRHPALYSPSEFAAAGGIAVGQAREYQHNDIANLIQHYFLSGGELKEIGENDQTDRMDPPEDKKTRCIMM